MRVRKGESGISLIALVVTLIVIFILSAISFSVIMKDDSTVDNAKDAADELEIDSDIRMFRSYHNQCESKNKYGYISLEEYLDFLEKYKINTEEVRDGENVKYRIENDGRIYEVSKEEAQLKIEYKEKGKIENPRIGEVDIKTNVEDSSISIKVHGYRLDGGTYTYYISKNKDNFGTAKESNKTGECTFKGLEKNIIYYIKIVGEKDGKTAEKIVEGTISYFKNDRYAPAIGSVEGSNYKCNVGKLEIKDIRDMGGSGLEGLYISKQSTTPTVSSSGWISNKESNYTKDITENGTYYVWAKDKSGNISERKVGTVSGIVKKVETVTLADAIAKKEIQ